MSQTEYWLAQMQSVKPEPNPCVRLFGKGPEAKCKTCSHLIRRGGCAKTFLKCEFRRNTRGSATDHKAGWNACIKYEEEK